MYVSLWFSFAVDIILALTVVLRVFMSVNCVCYCLVELASFSNTWV